MSGVDLAQWLTAQLNEDERIARSAGGVVYVDWTEGGWVEAVVPKADWKGPGDDGRHVASVRLAEDRAHIVQHDPARVLREVDAKRQLLAVHVIAVEKADVPPFDSCTGERNPDEYNVTCAVCGWASEDRSSACLTLRLLALPYMDRDGYRPEWAPSE